MDKSNGIESILWSIAFPGFGQILNGHFLKGALFMAAELIVNTRSNLNSVIISSFYWDIPSAVSQTNYQWLMFYPCIYAFAAWDAYKNSSGYKQPFTFMPFVLAAFLGTIGVIYSPTASIGGISLGPVWLPILCILLGISVGSFVMKKAHLQ